MDNHSTTELDDSIKYGAFSYSILLLTVGTVGNILLLITIIVKNIHGVDGLSASRDVTLSTTISSNNAVKGTGRNAPPRQRGIRTERMSVADQLLLMLTCADLLCLWILVLRYSIFVHTDFDIRVVNVFMCKVHTFLSMAGSNISIALLTIFSTHRAISIQWPLATYTWLSRKRLNIALVFAAVLIVAKHAMVLFTFNVLLIEESGSRQKCDVSPKYTELIRVYYYFEFITHVVIGYALLVGSNIWLAVTLTLKRNRPNCRDTTLAATRSVKEEGKPSASQGSGRTIAYVLLAFSIIQLVTSLPLFLLIEASQLFELNLLPKSANMLTYIVTSLSAFTNNGINYYVLLFISKRFRKDAVHVFRTILALVCNRDCFT